MLTIVEEKGNTNGTSLCAVTSFLFKFISIKILILHLAKKVAIS